MAGAAVAVAAEAAVAAAAVDVPIAGVAAVARAAVVAATPAAAPEKAAVAVAAEARSREAPAGEARGARRRTSRRRSDTEGEVEPLRLALVVQRYGEDVNGGAEYHCRLIAEHLSSQHQVEVLTSCARDYITWRNEHPPGTHEVNGVTVRRFRVKRPRDPHRFGRLSQKVFLGRHTREDELAWLEEQGPFAPALIRHLKRHRDDYDYVIFFSYRYYHSFYGVQALADQAVLVPTAEKDEVVGLEVFRALFQAPRAIVYNSIEERAMIWEASDNRAVLGDVVGVGSDVPETIDPELFPKNHGERGPYALYIGRIDPNKGCRTMFHFFRRYRDETGSSLRLLLIGGKQMEIPDEAGIDYAGFLSDAEKWSALAGATVLIMPSELESLSMVTLEAWALGKPVLANGKCDVLRGQCRRSNAGLYFDDYYEFKEALSRLESDSDLRDGLGANGARFFHEHYRWDVLEGKYNRLLRKLRSEDRDRPRPPRRSWLTRWMAS